MEPNAEDEKNPWITVSKTSRHSFTLKEPLQPLPRRPEVTNNFHNLSLQESSGSSIPGHPAPVTTAPQPPRKKAKKEKSHYPAIKINDQFVNKQVSLTDFRDLVLWILDDTTPPNWIEVKSRSAVKACVVLLVPGLSPQTFGIDTRGSEGKRMRRFDELPLPPSFVNIPGIFKYVWLPKAPGTNTALYSPVSAFMNCPLTISQSTIRAREQAKRKAVPVDIETLLLSPAEMRTAGYPVHPLHDDESSSQDDSLGQDETSVQDIVSTPIASESTNRKTVIGIDCEMCRTEAGMEITRVTLVDYQGNTLYDQLVKPLNPILDYLTTWSGITEERLLNTTTTLPTIQSSLLQIIDSNTILVGHSLESDLQCLKMSHPHIVDTSVIYQHSRGPPYKPSLKWLANKWLKRQIQESSLGHDSAQDASTCIDLVKMKCQKGKEFGLFNVDMESLFARLKRSGLDSAVVENGSRGNMFHGDHVRSCVSVDEDEEVVEGVMEALNTSHGLVWGKLKDLETVSKWKDFTSEENPTDEDLKRALQKFDDNVKRLWDELPPCTALMVITGSGDPREMSRLFARRKEYEKQLKEKKWDDIQVKWMDEDQQAYTLAVDKARTGLAFVAIK